MAVLQPFQDLRHPIWGMGNWPNGFHALDFARLVFDVDGDDSYASLDWPAPLWYQQLTQVSFFSGTGYDPVLTVYLMGAAIGAQVEVRIQYHDGPNVGTSEWLTPVDILEGATATTITLPSDCFLLTYRAHFWAVP